MLCMPCRFSLNGNAPSLGLVARPRERVSTRTAESAGERVLPPGLSLHDVVDIDAEFGPFGSGPAFGLADPGPGRSFDLQAIFRLVLACRLSRDCRCAGESQPEKQGFGYMWHNGTPVCPAPELCDPHSTFARLFRPGSSGARRS